MNTAPLSRDSLSSDRASTTLVEMLKARSQSYPDRLAFRFLDDSDDSQTITYRELDRAASRIAAGLREHVKIGDSVALVFPPGLDFIKAFLGCTYAGVLAIPATYPKPRRPSARLSAIVEDARPTAILATQRVIELLADSAKTGTLGSQTWLSSDELEAQSASSWQPPQLSPSDVAFLQYTSGSTKEPRGVMVSHGNITHNLEMIRTGFGLSCETAQVGVSWLPAYHDMGLIGGILESIYVGGSTVLMSPLAFLQRPSRWLRAISDYRAVVSGAPNFAYELCLKKIRTEDTQGLDLSSWRVAFSGAEPIRASTMRRFAETFGRHGFSESAFYPCYGLAEATLLATGGQGPGPLSTLAIDAHELQTHGRIVPVHCGAASSAPARSARGASGLPESSPTDHRRSEPIELVNCGSAPLGEEVLIVDPDTNLPCGEDVVGEIWIRGPHVARGYHNRAEDSESTFNGRLGNSTEDGFLRSGDLGFIHQGSLYVTGRRKELLIVRGRNHYPHDLEATVQNSHEKLIPGGGGAFLVNSDGDDQLVLVQEVDRGMTEVQRQAIIPEIRRNVTAEHDVFVHEVILIRMGSLPRTTSGKVRYADIKEQYRRGELQSVCQWSFVQPSSAPSAAESSSSRNAVSDLMPLSALLDISDASQLKEEIEMLLTRWLRQEAGEQDSEFDSHRPFADYGLDSLASMELIAGLENGLKLKLSPTIAWTYPSPATLARHLTHLIMRRHQEESPGFATATAVTEPQHESSDEEFDDTGDLNDDQFDQLLAELEQLPDSEAAAMLAAQHHPEPSQ